jgi:hypothetical protein
MSDTSFTLRIQQGATFTKSFIWKAGRPPMPVDLTGWTARLQMRSEIDAATVLLSLTTENGGITLGGTDGWIDLFISAEDTADITWRSAVYDLELVEPLITPEHVENKVGGRVIVTPEVTR